DQNTEARDLRRRQDTQMHGLHQEQRQEFANFAGVMGYDMPVRVGMQQPYAETQQLTQQYAAGTVDTQQQEQQVSTPRPRRSSNGAHAPGSYHKHVPHTPMSVHPVDDNGEDQDPNAAIASDLDVKPAALKTPSATSNKINNKTGRRITITAPHSSPENVLNQVVPIEAKDPPIATPHNPNHQKVRRGSILKRSSSVSNVTATKSPSASDITANVDNSPSLERSSSGSYVNVSGVMRGLVRSMSATGKTLLGGMNRIAMGALPLDDDDDLVGDGFLVNSDALKSPPQQKEKDSPVAASFNHRVIYVSPGKKRSAAEEAARKKEKLSTLALDPKGAALREERQELISKLNPLFQSGDKLSQHLKHTFFKDGIKSVEALVECHQKKQGGLRELKAQASQEKSYIFIQNHLLDPNTGVRLQKEFDVKATKESILSLMAKRRATSKVGVAMLKQEIAGADKKLAEDTNNESKDPPLLSNESDDTVKRPAETKDAVEKKATFTFGIDKGNEPLKDAVGNLLVPSTPPGAAHAPRLVEPNGDALSADSIPVKTSNDVKAPVDATRVEVEVEAQQYHDTLDRTVDDFIAISNAKTPMNLDRTTKVRITNATYMEKAKYIRVYYEKLSGGPRNHAKSDRFSDDSSEE
ncbi:MAG: hypothetical protein SGILL_004231, partial [Bacillariaceae sp.]